MRVVVNGTDLPFFSANPELVERSETREDAAAQPASVSPLDGVPRRMYLDLRKMNRENLTMSDDVAHVTEIPGELAREAVAEAREETPAACEDDVAQEHLAQLGVACAERLADQLREGLWEGRVGCLKWAGEFRSEEMCRRGWTTDKERCRVVEELFADMEPLKGVVRVEPAGKFVLPWRSGHGDSNARFRESERRIFGRRDVD
jgi:hypothetical protein